MSLDEEVRAQTNDFMDPGDMVVSWLTIAGVRRMTGCGYCIVISSEDQPPLWQVRGMLTDVLAQIDHMQLTDGLE